MSLSAAKYSSENRFMKVECCLGEDALLLRSLSGREGLSKLPGFQLHVLSYIDNIDPLELIGEMLLLKIDHDDSDLKHLSGYVNEFEYTGPHELGLASYQINIVPWFWFLKKRVNSRVFQNLTVEQIFEEICGGYDFAKFSFSLSQPLQPLVYCVQYRESDFDFLCRLLESVGVFFYFSYDKSGHMMHLADANSGLASLPDSVVTNALDGKTKLRDWRHQYRYCSTKISVNDFDFEKPTYSLLNETTSVLKLKNGSELAQYLYPGLYKESDQGEKLAKLLMEENEAEFDSVSAWSECRQLGPGVKFNYKNSNLGSDNGKVFVITDIEHEAIDHSYDKDNDKPDSYTNKLICLPEKYQYRPDKKTPKPRIDGFQTAIVVGKSGDEIYTDKYGRIKIQFHWDMYGEKNEQSSCWVRVATPWAGTKWGNVALPRVGQEVIVTFEEGDPDRPLVMGGLYNNTHMPPYDLPAEKNKTGVKSRSTKGGEKSTYNEISFDDTKGSEALTIHAQKDFNMNVGNNAGVSAVGNSTTSVDGNMSSSVGGDSSSSVSGNHTQSVTGNSDSTVDGNKSDTVSGDSSVTVSGNTTISTSGNTDETISGNHTVIVSGTQTILSDGAQTVSTSAAQSVTANGSQTVKADGAQTIEGSSQLIKANSSQELKAATISVQGDTEVTIAVGAASISISPTDIKISAGPSSVTIGPMGVSISGPMVNLN